MDMCEVQVVGPGICAQVEYKLNMIRSSLFVCLLAPQCVCTPAFHKVLFFASLFPFFPELLLVDEHTIVLCMYFVIFNDLQYLHDLWQHYMTWTIVVDP